MIPDVTVIIPTWNRLEWLKQSINSVLNQEGVLVDILVLNNGCTDGTREWLDSLTHEKIRVLHSPTNIRTYGNMYNVRDIRGRYVVPFTDDDVMLPGALARKVAVMDVDPSLGFIYSRCRYMDANGIDKGVWHMGIHIDRHLPRGAASFDSLFVADYVPMPSTLMRSDMYEKVMDHACDERFAPASDWAMWLYAVYLGYDAAYLYEPTVSLRIHQGQDTNVTGMKDGGFNKAHMEIWRYWMIESPAQYRPMTKQWEMMRESIISVTPPEALSYRLDELEALKRSVAPTLSVAIIVKNEQKNIRRCLGSVVNLADQVVVVDTGSTDHTRSIATGYHPKVEVHDFEWTNNFSEARNFAMDKCSSDWVLALDADEGIDRESYNLIREAIEDQRYDMYESVMRHHYLDGRIAILDGKIEEDETGFYSDARCTRLARNTRSIHWTGWIHEALTGKGARVGKSPFVIHHYGRMDSEREFSKRMIYLDLAMREHQDKPDDARCLFNYLMQANVAKDWDRMLHVAEIYIQRGGHVPAQVAAMVGEAMQHSGRLEEAVNYYALALVATPHDPYTLTRMASALAMRGEIEEAKGFLRESVEAVPTFTPAAEMLRELGDP
jgi:glycosyltransferase involved in cell wall biosynthesis